MDTKVNDESNSLSTVTDYATAIQHVSAGQFTSKFREDTQRFFATIYGAPFFALSRFAPEAIESSGNNLLVISPDPYLGAEGGRWLSLYAKIHKASKFNLTLCIPYKSPTGKAPKPILFQPPQQVLVKNWQKHLKDLSSRPSALIFYPENFDELETAATEFVQHAGGSKVLVSCYTRLDSLIARHLLASHGYVTSDVAGFYHAEDEPQYFAAGAWWFSAIVPDDRQLTARFSQGDDALEVDVLDLRSPEDFAKTPLPEVDPARVAALREAFLLQRYGGPAIDAESIFGSEHTRAIGNSASPTDYTVKAWTDARAAFAVVDNWRKALDAAGNGEDQKRRLKLDGEGLKDIYAKRGDAAHTLVAEEIGWRLQEMQE